MLGFLCTVVKRSEYSIKSLNTLFLDHIVLDMYYILYTCVYIKIIFSILNYNHHKL